MRMPARYTTALVGALTPLLLAACGATPTATPTTTPVPNTTPSPTPTATATPAPVATPTPTPYPDGESATHLDGTVRVTLLAPSSLNQNGSLTGHDVVIANLSDTSRTLYYSGNVLGFEVVDANDRLVWKHPQAWEEPLPSFELGAGESRSVASLDYGSAGHWDVRDPDGFPVPPGEYRIRGILTVFLDDSVVDSTHAIETPWQALIILPADLPV